MRKLSIMKVEYLILSIVVWCTFNESFSLFNILIGAALGRLFLKLSMRFLKEEIQNSNNKNFSLILYFLRLLVDMYINTIRLIYLIFTKQLDPVLVKAKVKSRGKVSSLIANSITLTPKTSCIDKEGDILTVLCAHEMERSEILDSLEIRTLNEEDLLPKMEFLKGE